MEEAEIMNQIEKERLKTLFREHAER